MFKSILLMRYPRVPIGIDANSPDCTHFRTVFRLTFIILATSSAVSISSSFIGLNSYVQFATLYGRSSFASILACILLIAPKRLDFLLSSRVHFSIGEYAS